MSDLRYQYLSHEILLPLLESLYLQRVRTVHARVITYLGVLPNRAKYATALLPIPKKIDPVPAYHRAHTHTHTYRMREVDE